MSHLSVSPSSPTSVTSGQRSTSPSPARPSLGRKPCIVDGCTELVAPSMWRNHMNALFPGSVPTGWLEENGPFICNQCSQLVAKSHRNSHQQKCINRGHSMAMGSVDLSSIPGPTNNVPIPTLDLFSFEDVLKLKCATIRHIPAKARPIFAKVLSAALREVLNKNTEEAWLNFFMLPKCVLLPSRRKGRHHKNSSIISLCKLWLKSEFRALWRHATNYNASNKTKTSKQFDMLMQFCHRTS